MSFITPWLLVALAGLPVLWWLLRVTPPAPRTENFPAIRLLLGLKATEETPARTPWWILLLRMLAAALIIAGLARPVLEAGSALSGSGPVLLVIDNGWAAAPEWARRMDAAGSVLDRAARADRAVALLATARDGSGEPPRVIGPMPATDLRTRLGALRPMAWPPDRAAATAALSPWAGRGGAVAYIADGLTHGGDFDAFATALGRVGAVTEVCCGSVPARVLLTPRTEADRLIARVAQGPLTAGNLVAGASDGQRVSEPYVLAQGGDGRTLARARVEMPPDGGEGTATIQLPLELRNRLGRLVLEGPASAGSVMLLDERWRRRPGGLLAGDQTAAEAPYTGPLYYLRRALAPYAELRSGDVATLLKRDISVIILADRPLPVGAERDALAAWVDKGGMLVRFAGPRTAEAPIGETDTLMPIRPLGGIRHLGGALSWSEPASLADFPDGSPFAGLAVPEEVRVVRQILAELAADMTTRTWARLTDGTPLVTQMARGAGRIVLFHVTANADWSNLPLSGLFVDMLRRLVSLSAGVASEADSRELAPAELLDGFGLLSTPTPGATALAADAFDRTSVSARHPPGLYGPESNRRALNLGGAIATLEVAPLVAGAIVEPLRERLPERELGPWLVAAAVLLLLIDTVIAMWLRGLLGARAIASALVLLAAVGGSAAASDGPVPEAALTMRLGYVVTGDTQVDSIAKAGLDGLAEYVNRRTSATLAASDPVEPGRSDLSLYSLLYWPIVAEAPALTLTQAAALNDFMAKGGIILIDTRDGGSGAGFAPGTDTALRRLAQGLIIPALTPLTTDHVLSRSFYLLPDFPGRFTGDPVWVQRDQDRTNDSVSPVIIGGHDWAAAWAVDANGRNPYAVIPGGQRQRVLAYRFGVNLVMYALTGNYKGDQVHVPAILQRLGQ